MGAVVIDPDDEQQMKTLVAAESVAWDKIKKANPDRIGNPTHEIYAEMLRMVGAGYVRPKPEEPTGLGAVVRAADGGIWIRVSTDPVSPWVMHRQTRTYADIDAVEVLSQGVVA